MPRNRSVPSCSESDTCGLGGLKKTCAERNTVYIYIYIYVFMYMYMYMCTYIYIYIYRVNPRSALLPGFTPG